MIAIGPHRFSEHDARRTVEELPALWAELVAGRDAGVVEHLRPAATGDLEADLAAAWLALGAAGPALRAAGQLPATRAGTVVALHRSSGGVPKLPVDAVEVTWSGIVGDVQATRRHHGRPWQAVCLWSAEVIEQLAAGGHGVVPGATGENVTLSGIPWELVRPGVRLEVGSVLCDVSAFALPCRKNARWFAAGEVDVMHHRRGPVSRVYATVVRPGRIAVGDAAWLEP